MGAGFSGTLQLFVVRNGELLQRLAADDYSSFHQRPYSHRRLIFPLSLSGGGADRLQLILHLDQPGPADFSPRLLTEIQLAEEDRFDS